jgi:hypothetical protein
MLQQESLDFVMGISEMLVVKNCLQDKKDGCNFWNEGFAGADYGDFSEDHCNSCYSEQRAMFLNWFGDFESSDTRFDLKTFARVPDPRKAIYALDVSDERIKQLVFGIFDSDLKIEKVAQPDSSKYTRFQRVGDYDGSYKGLLGPKLGVECVSSEG